MATFQLPGRKTFQKLSQLLIAPTVEPGQRASRIQTVETDIVMPIKGILIVILVCYLYFSDWIDYPHSARDLALNIIRKFFLVYAALNMIVGAVFFSRRRLELKKLEWTVFGLGLLDGLLLSALTFLTYGFDSILYWIFLVLILHNALAIPVAAPQLLLNILVSLGYILGGTLDKKIFLLDNGNDLVAYAELHKESFVNPLDRLVVLLLWAACCYGIQALFEKQKRAEAEATEFAVRQERLHTAGRMAAEIAHEIKNPLGIITNAAFSLQRAVNHGKTAVDEQIQIIREEVERADRIITELMGYAQLAEGKVEKLDVAEALDQAVVEVFPPAAKYEVRIHKNYAPTLPVLLMQRRHFSGVLVNILQNAREAMNGHGAIEILARHGENDSVILVISDTGPGIPPDKLDKIFEAYFTTRAKGTGLGLAIVKHNTEIYGGSVRVESELGKGTRFVLQFPARILMKLSQ